ncbi:MAG: hypothetical protein ACYDCQ_02035 [Dehalococcoidia bacterium]
MTADSTAHRERIEHTPPSLQALTTAGWTKKPANARRREASEVAEPNLP